MAKLNLTNKNLLSQDQELIADLKANGFILDFKGYYMRKIRNKAIQITPTLTIILSEISNPGRDETWNQYRLIPNDSTEELAQELSVIININSLT